jgi:hypothetical protein
MAEIAVEQALFDHEGQCLAQSSGFVESWKGEAARIAAAFGSLTGVRCPRAVFAQPLPPDHVAVVQVVDQPALLFHFLVLQRRAYERSFGDPFVLARQHPATWRAGEALPTLQLAEQPPARRTVADVCRVLKRVKAGALKEGEDPEAVERTLENSESPALLGGVQILVDGGKLVFERPAPDPDLVEGLWTLLPQTTRARLWPTSFAYSNELGFDVVVLPRVPLPFEEGYSLEEHAADYPEGRYERALQTAAEAGDQEELDALFQRRSSGDTVRLAVILLVIVSLVVLLIPRPHTPDHEPVLTPAQRAQRASVAAGSVAVGNPWTAAVMIEQGNRLFLKN